MFSYGQTIDPVTVLDQMKVRGVYSEASTEYIAELMRITPTAANVLEYAAIVRDRALLRNLASAADEINNLVYEGSGEAENILEAAESKIYALRQGRNIGGLLPISAVVQTVYENISEAASSGKTIPGLSTGLKDLDKFILGLNKGELVLIAARPAMGKSALALNFVNQVAKRNEGCVCLFSLEMPADSLMKRLMSAESRVYSDKLRSGKLKDSDMSKLNASATRLSERPIYIDDTSSIRVSQIFSKCRKLQSEHGSISLIVIDYLQLISGTRAESRQQEVSDISRNLKILAKEMNCPVIALSQLSRKVEERTNHEPQLSDLRESGSIEQDADIVMFLYRANYYEKDKEEQEETEVVDLSLAKHRNGGIGGIKLAFEKNISRFTNYANAGDDIYAN